MTASSTTQSPRRSRRANLLAIPVALALGACAAVSPETPAFVEKEGPGDIARLRKWTEVVRRMDTEQETFPARLKGDTSRLARRVDEIVNTYPYMDDPEGHWQTPREFFKSGGGDCEDFAIVKYGWLRRLGVPERDMKIAVVMDRFANAPHAVLLVDTGRESMMLDKRKEKVDTAMARVRYRPLFSFNRTGWWTY